MGGAGRLRLQAEDLTRRLAAADVDHWTKVIALVPSQAAPLAAGGHSSPAQLSALAALAAQLRTPVLGVIGSRAALSTAALASLGGGGVCIALEDAALAVTAPIYGMPLAAGESSLLARLPRGLGSFLALTGCMLGVHELVHVGIARDYIHSRTLALLTHALDEIDDLDLIARLPRLPAHATMAIGGAKAGVATATTTSPSRAQLLEERRARGGALGLHVAVYGQAHELQRHAGLQGRLAQIAELFDLANAGTVTGTAIGDVAARLARTQPSEWSASALQAMAGADPVGLELAARQLLAASRAPSLGACLRAEEAAVSLFQARTADYAERAASFEASVAASLGVASSQAPFGAFALLDAPWGKAPAAAAGLTAEQMAAQISRSARAAAKEVDGWEGSGGEGGAGLTLERRRPL